MLQHVAILWWEVFPDVVSDVADPVRELYRVCQWVNPAGSHVALLQ